MCLIENCESYVAFLTDLNNYKMNGRRIFQETMNTPDHLNFSDRMKGTYPVGPAHGVPSHAREALFYARRRKHDRISRREGLQGLSIAWAAQNAKTSGEFQAKLAELRSVSPTAAEYLNDIPHDAWALYPDALLVALFGHRTSNLVESANSKYLHALALNAHSELRKPGAPLPQCFSTPCMGCRLYY